MPAVKPTPPGWEKARPYRSLSLQRKFLLGVGVIFLAFCLIIALAIYTREKSLLEEAAHEKAEMVMAAAAATRSYVQEVLRPKMYQVLGQDAFLLEAMSTSYVSRAVMEAAGDKVTAGRPVRCKASSTIRFNAEAWYQTSANPRQAACPETPWRVWKPLAAACP